LRQIRTSLDNQKRDAASRFGMTEFLGCLVSGVWSVAKRDNLLRIEISEKGLKITGCDAAKDLFACRLPGTM